MKEISTEYIKTGGAISTVTDEDDYSSSEFVVLYATKTTKATFGHSCKILFTHEI